MFKVILLCLLSTNVFAQLKFEFQNFKFDNKGSAITDFTPHGTQPFLNFPMDSSSACGDCHGGLPAIPEDNTYMPYSTWSGSMMANATRDPLFWAAVDIANNDIPGVGDFCIRCHTPTGFYSGHTKDGTGNMSYANGCELTGTLTSIESKLNDYQGVTCHFCHRQETNGPSGEPLLKQNSNAWIDDNACDNPNSSNFAPCRKGPYVQPLNIPHEWEYSDFVKKGEFCGSCHNVSSPEITTNGVTTIARTLIDENGIDTGIAMPIERTFSEWKSSSFAEGFFNNNFESGLPQLSEINTSCQDCHMPQATDTNARACSSNDVGTRAGNLKTHEFAGGNSWMPEVLKNLYGSALDNGSFSRSDAFDRTVASALDMLQNKSALMEVSVVSNTGTQAVVNVKITNLSGHKLPTGYPEGRRMWINIQAKDNNNNIIFESGKYDSATATLNESGTKIYESLQGIWNSISNICEFERLGSKIFHFVLNDCIAKDNRIPPLGFTGGNDIQIKPRAYTYPQRPGFPNQTVNYDETQYTIDIPNGTVLPISVTATLKYQTSSKEYIEFLDAESTANAIPTENALCNRTQSVGPADQSRSSFMKSQWQNNGKSAPVDMVSQTLQL